MYIHGVDGLKYYLSDVFLHLLFCHALVSRESGFGKAFPQNLLQWAPVEETEQMVSCQQAVCNGGFAGKRRKTFFHIPLPPKYSISICDQAFQCMDFTFTTFWEEVVWVGFFFSIFCIGQAVYGHKGSYSKDKKKKLLQRQQKYDRLCLFLLSQIHIQKKKKICL